MMRVVSMAGCCCCRRDYWLLIYWIVGEFWGLAAEYLASAILNRIKQHIFFSFRREERQKRDEENQKKG